MGASFVEGAFHPDITGEVLDQLDARAEVREAIATLDLRSTMAVALRKRGRILGALQFAMSSASRRYTSDDVVLARSVAAPGQWSVVIGDVRGTGPSAAALTGLARHSIRDSTWHGDSPVEVLRSLHRAVKNAATGSYLTALYATLETSGPRPALTVASGGHPLPIHVDGETMTAVEVGLVQQAVHRGGSAEVIADQIRDALQRVLSFDHRNDDIALLVLEVR